VLLSLTMNMQLNLKKKRKLNGPILDETVSAAPSVVSAIAPQANGQVGAAVKLTGDEAIAAALLKNGASSADSEAPVAIAMAGQASSLLASQAATAKMSDSEKYQHHMSSCPEELDVESGAYDAVKIENFGMSMLMGMGYKPDSKKNKNDVKAEEVKRRPTRLGLGAKTLQGEGGVETAKKKVKAPKPVEAPKKEVPAAPLAPAKTEGAFLRAAVVVRITKSGSHHNDKCTTVSFNDGYWLVRLEKGGEEVEVKEKYLETVVKAGKFLVVLKDTGGWRKGEVGKVEKKGKESCNVEGWEGEGDLDNVCMLSE